MDIVINKLKINGNQDDIDNFLSEQFVSQKLSCANILACPYDLNKSDLNYEVEFIYSDFNNSLVFCKSDSGFTFKHVNASIFSYIPDSEETQWMIDNWGSTADIINQEFIVNNTNNSLEISFVSKYSAPYIWFQKLALTYPGLVFILEAVSYEYSYTRYFISNEGLLNYERENMPYFHQFESAGLIEDVDIKLKDTIGYYD